MTEKQLEEIRARVEDINEVNMISWCSKDMPALLNYIDDLKTEITKISAVLRQAADEACDRYEADLCRIIKMGDRLPSWYWEARSILGGASNESTIR